MNTPDEIHFNDDEWNAYRNDENERFVANIWSWDYKLDDFVQLIDPRCSICWKETDALNPGYGVVCKGILCPECKAHCFCTSCFYGSSVINHAECPRYLEDLRLGKIVHKVVPRFQVACKNTYFGEGAERLVCKLRFLGNDDEFIGPVMVAKESRFLEKRIGWRSKKERMSYHCEFMRTQVIAAEFARKFNKAIEGLVDNMNFYDNNQNEKTFIKNKVDAIPRIDFLAPLVIETIDPTKKRSEGAYDILVEPFLEGEYVKFNSNMGMVQGQARKS